MAAGSGVRAAVAAVVSLATVGGCAATDEVKNESRENVRFASSAGAQTFYEAYIAKTYTRPAGAGPMFEVYLPSPHLPYEHHEPPTDNVLFNAAVAAADTDHDGVISDDEARHYAQTVRQLPVGVVAVAKQ